MTAMQKLTGREMLTIDIMKAFAILSVISAHVISVSDTGPLSYIISSCWTVFGKAGVIIFFVIGGFLYRRSAGDGKTFRKKKFYRIGVPWLVCASVTYAVSVVLTGRFGAVSYLKWILGSETWYYYITVYSVFLFIFKWFCASDGILWFWIVAQTLSLVLASFGKSTTIPLPFFTDYLNPLHWIGYFSFGILIRKHRWDLVLRRKKHIVTAALLLALFSLSMLCSRAIFTYFHIVTSVFCVCTLIVAAAAAYQTAALRGAKQIGNIGTYSYCIYLLHMQIVQGIITRIPDGFFKTVFAPFIGLGTMLILIRAGLSICRKLPFGDKLKSVAGL